MLVLASASPRRRELLTQAGFTFTVHPAHIPEDPLANEDPIAYVTRLARQKAEGVFRQLATPTSSGASGPALKGHDFSRAEPDARRVGALAPEESHGASQQGAGAPSFSRSLRNGWETTTADPQSVDEPALYQGTTSVVPQTPQNDVGALAPAEPIFVLGADTTVTLDNHILAKPEDAADAARMLRLLSGRTHHVITGVAIVTAARTEVAAEVTAVRFLTLSDADIAAYIATGEPMDKAGAYAIQGLAARWIPRIEGDYFNVVGLPISLVATLLESL